MLRIAVLAESVVLLYGGVVHVYQLATGGWPPYGWAPGWLAVYFTALTVLDPLAAWLLLRGRAAGLWLGAAVLVTDAAANWYATYHVLTPTPAARIGQAVISVLAAGAVVVALCGRRAQRGPAGVRSRTRRPRRG